MMGQQTQQKPTLCRQSYRICVVVVFFYMKMNECDRLFHIIAHLPLDLCLSLFTAKMPVEITQILCSSSNYAI